MYSVFRSILNFIFGSFFYIFLAVLIFIGTFVVLDFIYKLAKYQLEDAVVISCEEKYFPNSVKFGGGYSYAPVAKTKAGVSITDNAFGAKSVCMNSIGTNVKVLINPHTNSQGAVYSSFGFWLPPILAIFISCLAIYKSISIRRLKLSNYRRI